uniref:Uncharacterized protein n=1 Tax=Rhizophora mucronata TaxID=61149 RepID=A0A2P2QKK8_RHIMU
MATRAHLLPLLMDLGFSCCELPPNQYSLSDDAGLEVQIKLVLND